MQRISAVLLLALFSFPLISPAVFADADSKLPACCRRDGKHRCARMSIVDQQESSGLAVKSAQQKCPYFPKASAVPAYSKTVLLKATLTIFAPIVSHPAIQSQTEVRYRTSLSRSQ